MAKIQIGELVPEFKLTRFTKMGDDKFNLSSPFFSSYRRIFFKTIGH